MHFYCPLGTPCSFYDHIYKLTCSCFLVKLIHKTKDSLCMSVATCQYLNYLNSFYWHSYVFNHIQDVSYQVKFSVCLIQPGIYWVWVVQGAWLGFEEQSGNVGAWSCPTLKNPLLIEGKEQTGSWNITFWSSILFVCPSCTPIVALQSWISSSIYPVPTVAWANTDFWAQEAVTFVSFCPVLVVFFNTKEEISLSGDNFTTLKYKDAVFLER